MLPTYPSSASHPSSFPSVSANNRFRSAQNIEVPISPVWGPMFPGNSFLCSKLKLTRSTNRFPSKKPQMATSTPSTLRCSWNPFIRWPQAFS